MAKRRGLLGEILHQSQQAAKQRERQAQAAHRAHAAAVRRAEQAQAQAARANAQYLRASAAEAKAMEKEAKRLQEEAMLAEVEERNTELADTYEQIDSILSATLDVDDYVDLEALRSTAVHPPFSRPDLEFPTPRVAPIESPPEPVYRPPDGAPKGLFGRKKYAEMEAQARAEFARVHEEWQARAAQVPALRAQQEQEYEQQEQQRRSRLEVARAEYDAECRQREADVTAANEQLDALNSGLQYGVEEAIQEYVSIVLSNSVYPECFAVEHDFEFDSAGRELLLKVVIPPPDSIPKTKEFKYTRAKNEITSTTLPAKEQKDRYANALAQVALRSLHEVFEADRAGRIRSISLEISTEALDAATGTMKSTPLLAVATDRDTFMAIELSKVVPSATLQHLNALVSKNPFDLVPIDTSKGVRGR